MDYRMIPVGDQAVAIEMGTAIDPAVNQRLQTIGQAVLAAHLPMVKTVIPGYATLTVTFNGQMATTEMVMKKLTPLIDAAMQAKLAPHQTWLIPVCYGGEFGPDLADVATFAKCSAEEVIAKHTSRDYLIYFMGFLPGFAYMGSVVDEIAMPRLAEPRLEIPAGSVGIAGAQTGFYPVASPGGWRIIGQTPLKLYDPAHPQSFYHAGDLIRFQAVSSAEFATIKQSVAAGTYQPKGVA